MIVYISKTLRSIDREHIAPDVNAIHNQFLKSFEDFNCGRIEEIIVSSLILPQESLDFYKIRKPKILDGEKTVDVFGEKKIFKNYIEIEIHFEVNLFKKMNYRERIEFIKNEIEKVIQNLKIKDSSFFEKEKFLEKLKTI